MIETLTYRRGRLTATVTIEGKFCRVGYRADKRLLGPLKDPEEATVHCVIEERKS